ncbi:MAG TPA: hypothetical protein VGQ16_09320 [Vicinamibacterales bacterium]|nr:hypothetical protein [Vicinamibacterales bacterium]
MNVQRLLGGVLLLLGAGFLVANARLILEYVRFLRRRPGALLVWPSPKPPYYGVALAIGVMMGVLVFYKLVYLRQQAFGEIMMFAYYAYLTPLSRRIGRGFYEDGIWADNAFIPYHEIGGISWREGEREVALIVISRLRNLARRLIVPGDKYGAARRLLRDKIGEHEIHFMGTGLDLGAHDERDEA